MIGANAMDLTRRDFMHVAAVSAATLALPLVPALASAATPASPPARTLVPSDPFALDELPIQGVAGECSCAGRTKFPPFVCHI